MAPSATTPATPSPDLSPTTSTAAALSSIASPLSGAIFNPTPTPSPWPRPPFTNRRPAAISSFLLRPPCRAAYQLRPTSLQSNLTPTNTVQPPVLLPPQARLHLHGNLDVMPTPNPALFSAATDLCRQSSQSLQAIMTCNLPTTSDQSLLSPIDVDAVEFRFAGARGALPLEIGNLRYFK